MRDQHRHVRRQKQLDLLPCVRSQAGAGAGASNTRVAGEKPTLAMLSHAIFSAVSAKQLNASWSAVKRKSGINYGLALRHGRVAK